MTAGELFFLFPHWLDSVMMGLVSYFGATEIPRESFKKSSRLRSTSPNSATLFFVSAERKVQPWPRSYRSVDLSEADRKTGADADARSLARCRPGRATRQPSPIVRRQGPFRRPTRR